MTELEQPLAGLRVIELATGISGPYAGKLLADFGADVIKVEAPGGDPTRLEGARPGPRPELEGSPLFLHLNANKRSVLLDAQDSGGLDRIHRLIDSADLVIEASRPGQSSPLDPLELVDRRSDLVVTSVTPFGRTGPYAGRLGAEIVAYAMGGPMNSTGVPDSYPLKLAGNIVQYQAGSVAALSSMAALRRAGATGRGAHVDVSNFTTQSASIDRRLSLLVNYGFTGRVGQREGGNRVGLIPAGVFPTADGYCQIVFAPNWLPRVADMFGNEELIERIASPDWYDDEEIPELMNSVMFMWTLERSKQQAMDEAQSRKLAITPVNITTEVLVDDHFRSRDFWAAHDHPVAGRFEAPGAQFRMREGWKHHRAAPLLGEHTDEVLSEQLPVRVERPLTEDRLPLEGVRVLDMTVVWAGPLTTMLLGDLGAEVIRLDNPNLFPTATRGALMRPSPGREAELGQYWGGFPDGEGGERPWNRVGAFACHSRNKLGASLDLRTDLGRETFLRLVEQSDVFVENNSAKVMDSLGLGWEVLHERNPRLIMLRMPALGLSGPYRDFVGFGAHMEALCGLSSLRGYKDLDPSSLDGTYFMDPASGSTAAFATLTALQRRDETGEGELIEFAQAENLLSYIGEYIVDASLTGDPHDCHDNRHPHRAPQGVYGCLGEERWLVISVADDAQWRSLVDVMGEPQWALDSRYLTEEGRRLHHDELDEKLGQWTVGLDRDEVVRRLVAADIPAGPVLNEVELSVDPHLAAQGFMRMNGSSDVPLSSIPGHQWKWTGPDMCHEQLNCLGRDNEYVYKDVVGLTDDEYAALDAERHLSLGYFGPDGELL